jgi:hypothetical protein
MYTEDLKSSDGSTIGYLTGIDFASVKLSASRSTPIHGDSISVYVCAEMSSKPLDAVLDISIGGNDRVPDGMDNIITLAVASISSQSRYGWAIKSDTLAMKFTIPASRLSAASADVKYYLVHFDGVGYQIIPVNVETDKSSATIEAKVPALSGVYSLVMSCPLKTVSTSTPLPTMTPTPIPCPSPAPETTGITHWISSLWVSVFGTFAIGEVAGAMILLGLNRFMR